MTKIHYIEFDGSTHSVDVEDGWSVMKGAVFNGVPGIDAECGGACACATCHVYVDSDWIDRVPSAEQQERDTLEFALEAQVGSRLSCQIKVTPELDGLVVRMPEAQS
ncbi:2Fe-2S iron-sulfur cluster-binding protein [Caballeronia zhejiangensis]|uniref:2Fe-2S iron-sulfur cluster-binding protein n=1 Tax=Caballeronia zhejiangensis TaxID=871203 RepID=UPI001F5163EE|nr:2Fe-2S iron-sulfur cluster-binding protein [Caballeronia zhejiangensis]MCI1047033.1 2Fe-2S iron-sulfur cluster binding domain-containing protein [Caballeronia zhejiangensis]